MQLFVPALEVSNPPTGWIRATRTALGMSLEQLGARLDMTKQGVMKLEAREVNGALTIKSLKEAARALDMQLVYGLVPNDGSLDALIERKALELAKKIVTRTSTTMKLEDQANSPERLNKAIQERAQSLKLEMPKILWD
ncbi:mobile mystery protein A [Ekhidna sp.]|uniref:mobile mystery protein A n=1 Tax=Ekhidna sp. TaxID=2608089 RepID=UPI003B5A7D65